MYAGEADKGPAMDPYADAPGGHPNGGAAPANGNPDAPPMNGGRGRSRSRSRSRSPRRFSPGGASASYNRRRSPPPRRPAHAPMAPNPSNVLGVFGLSIRTVERQLEEEFSRYGHVDKVTIVYDARTGRSRGFGFIKMAAVEEATACIEKLNGVELDGRRIRVDYSVTDRPHAPTPGEYMGTRRDDGRRGFGRYERYERYDRDRDYGRDRRDRDRDPYGREDRGGGYRGDWRDRDREYRRSPPRGSRYSASPPPRRRRSFSRSPPRDKRDDIEADSRAARW
ncbi:hypothetical protein FRC04_008926 [Tulasnella sp. 424]|nr:hypothetical protein FRC04_008926 [Tulasnella sp. 424]KAG8973824.1 hypothetical protein FRC05_008244 [Tulasnella sp. 425]